MAYRNIALTATTGAMLLAASSAGASGSEFTTLNSWDDWTLLESYHRISESRRYIIYTRGQQNRDALLLMICGADHVNKPYLRYATGDVIGGDQNQKGVYFRVEGYEKQEQVWNRADGRVNLLDRGKAEKLVEKMKGQSWAAFQVLNYDFDQLAATFSLNGFEPAAEELYEKCQYPDGNPAKPGEKPENIAN